MGDKKGKLTTVSCVTIMMGAMIGSAIFSLSGVTYAMAGPAHILTWIAAAVILLIYGACLYVPGVRRALCVPAGNTGEDKGS